MIDDELDRYLADWGFIVNSQQEKELKEGMWNTLDDILALPTTYLHPIKEESA